MHIVTKFLVVFAAILGVILSALSIAYTANADRLASAIRDERNKAQESQAAASEANSRAARAEQALDEQKQALQSTIDSLTSQVERLDRENAKSTARIKELEQSAIRYDARIADFTAIIDAFAKLDEARSAELEDLRDKELRAARREIELTDRINDLAGQLEVSIETNRTLQEQLAEAREAAEQAQGGGLASDGEYRRAAPRNFRARVIDVVKEADGTMLVGIDAGSNDGLQEDMKLMVTRSGGGFVANLLITRVDMNEAVARVTLQNLQNGRLMEVNSGDLVIASPL